MKRSQYPPAGLCVDCLNFKTKVATKANFKQLKFESLAKIRSALKHRKEARIYWCIYGRTPQEVYIEHNPNSEHYGLSTVLKMEVKDCKAKSLL